MNAVTAAVSLAHTFALHKPLVFSPKMMKKVNEVFDDGAPLKHLYSRLPSLLISDKVMDYFGSALTGNLKGVTPGLRRVEFLRDCTDTEFFETYGPVTVFTPAQFWNSVVKIAEHERTLENPDDTIFGEDIFGIVFIVEKTFNTVPKKFSINFFREQNKDRFGYRIMSTSYGSMWERGHYFISKISP
jgi:hypothetical protein